MSFRAVIAAAAALFALLAVAGPALFLKGPGASALSARRDPVRLEIRRPREDLILEKEGDDWRVPRQDGDLADAESVALLLAGLRALEFGPELDSARSAVAYGLGPADAIRVRALDASGAVAFDGQFGRRAFARSAYFRASERDGVRLAMGLDPSLLGRSSAQWREPRLLPGGCAGGLELLKGRKWVEAPAETARELCALRASRWADGAAEAASGFEAPLLSARTRDGRAFVVGDKRGSERLVRVQGRAGLLRAPAGPLEAAAYLLRSQR